VDVYQLVVHFTSPVVGVSANVLHYQRSTTDPGDPFDIADDLITAWQTANELSLRGCVSHDVTLDAYSAKRVSIGGGPTVIQAVNHPGLDADDLADSTLAGNLRIIPAAPPYARREGHFYVGGIAASRLVENQFTSVFVTTMVALADALETPFPAGGTVPGEWQLVIFDRKLLSPADVGRILAVNKPVHLKRRMTPYPI
jgi:hypothetical protein